MAGHNTMAGVQKKIAVLERGRREILLPFFV
jgi:hypothetical protein